MQLLTLHPCFYYTDLCHINIRKHLVVHPVSEKDARYTPTCLRLSFYSLDAMLVHPVYYFDSKLKVDIDILHFVNEEER